jgi:excisionase family DNA binding protein
MSSDMSTCAGGTCDILPYMTQGDIRWLSTGEAARRLGVSLRTLYKFIDEGSVPAYKFGRVIRLQEAEVDGFIGSARIEPGTLEHLYPEAKVGSDDE